jgi:hypothetical protein
MGGSAYSQGAVEELAKPHFEIFKAKWPKLQYDNRIILLKLATIRFSRLKATDLTAVSNGQCQNINQFDLFLKLTLCIQITKQYKIAKYFKTALEQCPDVTETVFPHLYHVNVNKLLKKSQKKIMIFVVRLHYARHVLNTFECIPIWNFNFKTFPELREVLMELEFDLKMVDKLDVRKRISTSPASGNDAISSRILAIKAELASARETMVEMRQCIDRVETGFDIVCNDIRVFQAETRALQAETRANILEEATKKYWKPKVKEEIESE